MTDLPKLYFTQETYLFPQPGKKLGELTAKMRKYLRLAEMIKPSRPMTDWEKMLRAFFLKAVYGLPTAKGLIEKEKVCGAILMFSVISI